MKKLLFIIILIVIGSLSLLCFSNNSEIIPQNSSDSKSKKSLLPNNKQILYTNLPDYSFSSEEIYFTNEDQTIYGLSLIPKGIQGKLPLIICCHGLGNDYLSCLDYAEIFAQKGIASLTFDFRGGGGSNSDGQTTDMSVMTEVSDLNEILDKVQSLDYIDPSKIVLFGQSQGGLVASIVAARRPDEIAGLILEYPAFIINDTIHSFIENPNELPESYNFGGILLGKKYAQDMWEYDSFSEIANYPKHVLILQGSEDKIETLEYTQRAAHTFPDVEFYIIEGSGHGFAGEAYNQVLYYIFNYLEKIYIIPV